MTERYTRVYTLESNQYQIDAPVIVVAGALLKDNTNNKVLAQLKFKSISDKIIKALKVSVQPLDVKGEQLGSVVEYQYLDLSANRDEEFGQKAPIRLPDNNTRQFSVKILESLFEDSTEWKADSFESEIISEPESLADVLHNDSELIEQFRLECGENNTVMPIFHGAYWICSCGAFNRNDEADCHACNKEKSVLININLENLEEKKESRLKNGIYDEAVMLAQEDTVDSLTIAVEIMSGLSDWKDAEEKVKEFEIRIKDLTYEEAVTLSKQDTVDSLKKAQNIMTGLSGWKNADEEAANYEQRIESLTAKDKADKAAKKKKIIIASSVLCAIIAIVIVVTQFIIPNQKYNNAVALMEEKKYKEAVNIFESISGYKDSKAQMLESKYLLADQYFNEGKPEEAYKVYQELDGYKETHSKKVECLDEIKYLTGNELMEKGSFQEAYKEFKKIPGYKDSDKKIEQSFNNLVKEAEIGSTISFCSYNWLVLAKEADRVLVISEEGIGSWKYGNAYIDVTWETSPFRKSLNSSFYNETFSEIEQSKILTSTVTADRNPKYDTNPGNNTEDKVFLLSIQEAEKYFASDEARSIGETWWLRTPGEESDWLTFVTSDGSIYNGGMRLDYDSSVIRPAMWISIE